ncbi:MAG: hypothetical protein CLLPBCKN_006526 [Chroococcidiopsis cubana SAG 39.79]|uniref:hypothetical protein n=1 Tax=Chroococcidiopsis cubana TaxID=171392 RepID=UPI000F8DF887|nr:hypothetical protein [Chroococcidiopsis cubana]MDZ4877091.1 hypothetical protein [Chroococcidiopsis cubana SAG 39.79]
MVSHQNLLPASDGALATNLPMGGEAELPQCWIGEGIGIRVTVGNYQRSSLTGQIRSINCKEMSEILKAMADYLSN